MTLLSQERKAYIAPFIVFMLLLGLVGFLKGLPFGGSLFFIGSPQYWIFPLQTVVCGGLMIRYWRHYQFRRPTNLVFTLFIAVLVLVLWISPQLFFHQPSRRDGFDPTVFQDNPLLYYATVALRFLRMAVVVPFLEEIFWRGFLLRDLIHEDFKKVPFGAFSWMSFAVVTFLFGLEHYPADFWPGIVTGALYNLIIYRTRSLASCVLAHAVTNLGLGIYIMQTKQWGFW